MHFVVKREREKEGKKGGEIPKRHSPFLSLILSFYISVSVFLFADVLNIHLIRSIKCCKNTQKLLRSAKRLRHERNDPKCNTRKSKINHSSIFAENHSFLPRLKS